MSEYEYDHVFVGTYDGVISPNPDEVTDWATLTEKDVRQLMEDNPERFTYWFRELFCKYRSVFAS